MYMYSASFSIKLQTHPLIEQATSSRPLKAVEPRRWCESDEAAVFGSLKRSP